MADDNLTEAQQRLREFEHETFGADAPRIDGHLERGHGSLIQRAGDAHRKAHDALLHVVHTETAVEAARAKLNEVEDAHAKAMSMADAAVRAVPQPPKQDEEEHHANLDVDSGD